MHSRGVTVVPLLCGIHLSNPWHVIGGMAHSVSLAGRRMESCTGVRGEVGMKRMRIAFGALILLTVSSCTPNAASAQNLTCGLKPIPEVGCRIGRCVDGAWEQVCD